MLFGTWSQAQDYDPSDYIETRLELSLVNELNRLLVETNNGMIPEGCV